LDGPEIVTDGEVTVSPKITAMNSEEFFPNNESGLVAASSETTRKSSRKGLNALPIPYSPDELGEAAAAVREQKAVKSGDAAVPIHLWEQTLLSENQKWTVHKRRFRRACEVVNTGMLSY
jgi:hypothetical protein